MEQSELYFLKAAADLFDGRKVPDWVANHPAIKDKEKINKVFPKVGLPNFRQKLEISEEAKQIDPMSDFVVSALWSVRSALDIICDAIINETEEAVFRRRNQRTSQLVQMRKNTPEGSVERQKIEQEIEDVSNGIKTPEQKLSDVDDKIAASNFNKELAGFIKTLYPKMGAAISGTGGNVVLVAPTGLSLFGKTVGLKGQSLPAVFGKIRALTESYLNKLGTDKDTMEDYLPLYDQLDAIKQFNRLNIPMGNELWIVFSSEGVQGAWDIATMSMRGLKSCQKWNEDADPKMPGERTSYNCALVGSIASQNVGIIYLTSGKNYNGMGEKMIKRSIVRYAIDTEKENSGVIIVDRMYESYNESIAKGFIDAITARTKLRVVDMTESQGVNAETAAEILGEGVMTPEEETPVSERSQSYRDTKIPDYDERIIRRRREKIIETALSHAYNEALDLYPGTESEKIKIERLMNITYRDVVNAEGFYGMSPEYIRKLFLMSCLKISLAKSKQDEQWKEKIESLLKEETSP